MRLSAIKKSMNKRRCGLIELGENWQLMNDTSMLAHHRQSISSQTKTKRSSDKTFELRWKSVDGRRHFRVQFFCCWYITRALSLLPCHRNEMKIQIDRRSNGCQFAHIKHMNFMCRSTYRFCVCHARTIAHSLCDRVEALNGCRTKARHEKFQQSKIKIVVACDGHCSTNSDGVVDGSASLLSSRFTILTKFIFHFVFVFGCVLSSLQRATKREEFTHIRPTIDRRLSCHRHCLIFLLNLSRFSFIILSFRLVFFSFIFCFICFSVMMMTIFGLQIPQYFLTSLF